MSSNYKRLNTRIDLQEKAKKDEHEDDKGKGKRTLQPIISPYALEDPMYQYIQEKRRKEKDERVRQLKSLLNSSTDSSSDSSVSESDSDRRKRRRKRHKEDSKHERKSSRSPVDESRQKRKKKSKKLKKKKRKKSSKKVEWVDASTLPDRVKMTAEAADNVGVHGGVQIKTEKIDDGYMNAVIKTEPTDNNSMGADGASVCTTNVPNMKQECGLHEHISSSNISIKGEPPWPKSSHIYEGAPSTAATSSNRDSGDGNVASETGSSHTTNDEERIRRLMLHVASQSKLSHS